MIKIAKVDTSHALNEAISKVVNAFQPSKLFPEGSSILLKPNFNTADPFPASTDPFFLKHVIKFFLELNPSSIYIGDACTFSQKTEQVMNDLKIIDLQKIDDRIKVIDFDKHNRVKKTVKNGKYLKNVWLPNILDEVDKLVYLPCLKTHFIAEFTGSLKLSIGFLSKKQKLAFHMKNLQEKIVELNTVINPDLIIMDARKCFITRGPSDGEVREPNQIIASDDRLSVDIKGINIIKSFQGNSLEDKEPTDLIQISYAKKILSQF